MPVAVTASLVGTSDPRAVQVVVTGLTVGDQYEIRGNWSGGSWPVRAGTGTADASQVVRTDVQSPVNIPVTYTVAVGGLDAATSAPVTVDYAGRYVLQSLDGKRSAQFRWLDNGAPREHLLRSSVFFVPGRPEPVVVYDVAAGEDGELLVATGGTQTAALRDLVRAGAPLLLRTDGTIRDVAAVEFVQLRSARSALSGAGVGSTNDRRWTLGFTVLADPEPNTLVASSTWDDFDAVYTGLTWVDFDGEWAGSTWNQFDLADWATRAGGA